MIQFTNQSLYLCAIIKIIALLMKNQSTSSNDLFSFEYHCKVMYILFLFLLGWDILVLEDTNGWSTSWGMFIQ